jgi:hypothetical protein
MSKPFKVGDIAILQHGRNYPELDGEEVEIIEGLAVRTISVQGKKVFAACYRIVLVNKPMPEGHRWFHSEPHQLRPKRPPRRAIDEVVRWESVGWMPMDVKLDRAITEMLRNQVGERA